MNTLLDDPSTTYQIDLNTASNGATLALSTVSTNMVSETEIKITGNRHMLYPPTTIFSTVCLGGSLLEYRNYNGTVQNAFYGYNSLLEERNFCQLDTRGVDRSDLIVFADNGMPRSLGISRFSLNSHMISFQFRYPDQDGAVMVVENSEYQFILSTIGGGSVFPVINHLTSPIFSQPCCDSEITDMEWHSLEVRTITNTLMTFSLDGESCCSFNDARLPDVLASLSNETLQFGATHDSITNSNGPQIFSGCLQAIEIRETETSEPFRPNLEAVPRVDANFDIGPCHHCLRKAMRCDDGRECIDTGQGVESECRCPEGFAGPMCEGM